MNIAETQYGNALEITPHNEWSQKFWDDLVPYKNRISQHPVFLGMADGSLSIDVFRYALLNFYPLVAHFPAYMGIALSKSLDFSNPTVVSTRNWLIQNIKVEERHLNWYQDWAQGFGISLDEMNQVLPPPAMNAINHYLWNISTRGSLAECLAATNLAIEWATGDWTIHVYKGIQIYNQYTEVKLNKRTLAWLRAHAHYDDLHPYEAMELIKRLCDNNLEMQKRAFEAARQGLEYYLLALDDCYNFQCHILKKE